MAAEAIEVSRDGNRHERSQLALAVLASRVGLWTWDLVTDELDYSVEWKRQIGYEPHEIDNTFEEWRSRVHPDDLEHCMQQVSAFVAQPWPDYELEFRFRHRDGSYRWIVANALLERDESGRPLRMFGSHVDVTDRKRTEAQLHAAQCHQAALVDQATSDAMFLHDDYGRFLAVNQNACDSLGYSRQELMSLTVFDIVPAFELQSARAEWNKLRADGSLRLVGEQRRKDGSTFPVEARFGLLERDGERLYVVLCRDMTSMLDAERAHEITQAKSAFIASVSHEFRTPLNAIIGFAEVLQQEFAGDLNADQKRFVTEILGAGKHLHSLVNDVLDLAKVESGKLDLTLSTQPVMQLLESAATVCRGSAARNGVSISARCEDGLDRVVLDERKSRQILYNLVSNAAKFSKAGSTVTIAAARRQGLGHLTSRCVPTRVVGKPVEGELLEFSVADSGPGLTEDQMGQLFEPFMQLRGVAAHAGEGTGLGLALVRRFAELHGGMVGIASDPGEGSTFYVWLPLRLDAA